MFPHTRTARRNYFCVSLRMLSALLTRHTSSSSLSALAAKIQNDLRILTERLARINDNLARKITSRNEYDKTIQETEAAYSKVRARCCGCRPPLARRWPAERASRVCAHVIACVSCCAARAD